MRMATRLVLGAVLAIAGVALAGETVVQVYKCPACDKVEQYAENGYHTHYCEGTKDKPHSKRIMSRIGEQKVKN